MSRDSRRALLLGAAGLLFGFALYLLLVPSDGSGMPLVEVLGPNPYEDAVHQVAWAVVLLLLSAAAAVAWLAQVVQAAAADLAAEVTRLRRGLPDR